MDNLAGNDATFAVSGEVISHQQPASIAVDLLGVKAYASFQEAAYRINTYHVATP
jgi:hypothetical protein